VTGLGFNWDEPTFGSAQVTRAVGCDSQWLTNLVHKGLPDIFSEDEFEPRPRRRRLKLKFRTAFQVALMRQLQAFLTLHDAADAANHVVHCDYLFSGDLTPNGGDVFLVAVALAPGDPHPVYSSVVVPGAFLGEVLGTKGTSSTAPRIVFNVTPVFDRVVKGLGL
jgi:hypothetical protein